MKKHIPKVIELVVNNDLCIGCGLCTYKCPSSSLEMNWNENGFLVPEQIDECCAEESCITVCPFNPLPKIEVETEDKLANVFFSDANKFQFKIGKYENLHVGSSNKYRLNASSGGLATYVLIELLERKIVDFVFSVGKGQGSNHYQYCISSTSGELLQTSKTKYYPVTLANVFKEVTKLDGKIAIVGVGCFIKAIRLAQFEDPKLREKIPFLIGIICGGVKSKIYSDYLSSKAGVPPMNSINPMFRIKDYNSTASDYSFGCSNVKDNSSHEIKMRKVGDMWGSGLFKANACDFCEDVTSQLADISLGDAWLEPYSKEGKGASVIVTRSKIAEKIINEGTFKKELDLEKLSLDDFLKSQNGSFNHRHKGLSFRLKEVFPLKFSPKFFGSETLSFDLNLVQFMRRRTRRLSFVYWNENKEATKFDKKMKFELFGLKIATKINHLMRAYRNGELIKKVRNKFKF